MTKQNIFPLTQLKRKKCVRQWPSKIEIVKLTLWKFQMLTRKYYSIHIYLDEDGVELLVLDVAGVDDH